MRSHGVPTFPDPGRQMPAEVDPNSPQYQAAERACRPLLAQGNRGPVPAADLESALEFSACIRAHGLPDFPDPKVAQGNIQLIPGGRMVASPQFQAGQRACEQYLGRPPSGNLHPGGPVP